MGLGGIALRVAPTTVVGEDLVGVTTAVELDMQIDPIPAALVPQTAVPVVAMVAGRDSCLVWGVAVWPRPRKSFPQDEYLE